MKSLKDYRRSLSARLSVWTVLVVTAIFLAALSIMFTESEDRVRLDTLGKARQTLDGTVLHASSRTISTSRIRCSTIAVRSWRTTLS